MCLGKCSGLNAPNSSFLWKQTSRRVTSFQKAPNEGNNCYSKLLSCLLSLNQPTFWKALLPRGRFICNVQWNLDRLHPRGKRKILLALGKGIGIKYLWMRWMSSDVQCTLRSTLNRIIWIFSLMAYWMLILDTKIGEIHIVVAKYVFLLPSKTAVCMVLMSLMPSRNNDVLMIIKIICTCTSLCWYHLELNVLS